MTFDEIYSEILERYKNSENGYYNCIPWSLERLSPIVPGIIPGEYYLITGSSGSAKSKITRSLFIHEPYEYIKNNPNLDIKLDILYWSLEENVKKIYATELSRLLKTKFNENVSFRSLMSIGKENMLSYHTIEHLKECMPEFDRWKEHIHVFGPEISNPTGIMKMIESFAYDIGRYYHKDGKPFTNNEMIDVKKGKGEWIKDVKFYKTDHPRHYVLVIIDHVSLITLEAGLSLQDNIYRLSSEYLLRAKDRFGFIPVIVQQQNSLKERMQFTSNGSSIEEKLEPSLDSLANCTTTQREATIAFGIFGPARYGITEHNGYNISILKDNYRSLKLLKQRDERANVVLPLFFYGVNDIFKTLPQKEETEKLNKLYENIQLLRNGKA